MERQTDVLVVAKQLAGTCTRGTLIEPDGGITGFLAPSNET